MLEALYPFGRRLLALPINVLISNEKDATEYTLLEGHEVTFHVVYEGVNNNENIRDDNLHFNGVHLSACKVQFLPCNAEDSKEMETLFWGYPGHLTPNEYKVYVQFHNECLGIILLMS